MFFKERKFKFENHWLLEEGLEDVVSGSWSFYPNDEVTGKLRRYARDLKNWGNSTGPNFRKDIVDCKRKMELVRNKKDRGGMNQLSVLRRRLAKLLVQEEVY